jgi:2-dehydro-3-deoxygluconokinase
LRSLKGKVGRIALDLNVRPALWEGMNEARAVIASVMAIADIVRSSRDDAELLFAASAPSAQIQALHAAGGAEIVLTLDADGCLVHSGGEVTAIQPLQDVKVVDTTGAGDCFDAGFLAGLWQDMDLESCAKMGAACASFCIEAVGGTTGIPTLDKVRERAEEK